MTSKRILIVTNRIPFPLKDGGALAMNAMIEGYHKHGWQVHLLCMNTSRHYVSTESLPDLYKSISFETFEINTDVKLVPTLTNFFFSKKPNHVNRFHDKDFMKRLDTAIRNFEPDIVQIESVYLASYVSGIRRVTNAQVAIRLHNIEYEIWERLSNESTSTFKRYYLKDLAARIKKFELDAWSQADILIPITRTDAEKVADSIVVKRIVVAPFGIDTSRIETNIVHEKWEGFHIGAMDWMPNAEAIRWFLEEVWPKLHEEVPGFKFHFAGRNMPGSFQKYEGDGVVCEGEVPDARAFIADKKVLIVPLRSGGGIRIKILEAMAAGKLVVSTTVGMQGIDDAIPGIHFLLADTERDFIDQIKWLVENNLQASEIAHEGYSLVLTKYDQKKIMTRLINEITLTADTSRL